MTALKVNTSLQIPLASNVSFDLMHVSKGNVEHPLYSLYFPCYMPPSVGPWTENKANFSLSKDQSVSKFNNHFLMADLKKKDN